MRLGGVELAQPGESLFQRASHASERGGLLLDDLVVENIDRRAVKAKIAGHARVYRHMCRMRNDAPMHVGRTGTRRIGTQPAARRCVLRGAKPIVMRFELTQAGFGRTFDFLPILLLSTTMAVTGAPALASEAGDDPAAAQHQPQQQPSADKPPAEEDHQARQNDGPEPGAPPAAPRLCEALASA